MKKVLTASCLCKGVKFKTLNKLRSVSNCHCVQCRKTHGVFGAYTNIKDKELKFLYNIFSISKETFLCRRLPRLVLAQVVGLSSNCRSLFCIAVTHLVETNHQRRLNTLPRLLKSRV